MFFIFDQNRISSKKSLIGTRYRCNLFAHPPNHISQQR